MNDRTVRVDHSVLRIDQRIQIASTEIGTDVSGPACIFACVEVRKGDGCLHPEGMTTLLLVFAGVNFLFMPVFVLLPLYVRNMLGGGPDWYGLGRATD